MIFTLHFPGWLRNITTGMLVLVMHCAVFAQNDSWKIKHISTESGLSNRFVTDILQDSRGYTWISTKFGLNRYDGHRFDILTRESHHLQSNVIHQLYLDPADQLWLIGFDDPGHSIIFIDVIDPISLTAQSLQNYISTPLPFKVRDIEGMVNDSLNNLFILTKQNNVYQFDQKKFVHLFQIPSAVPGVELGIGTDILVTTAPYTDSLDIWDKKGKWLSRHPVLLSDEHVRDGEFWRPAGTLSNGKLLMVLVQSFSKPMYYCYVDKNGISAIHPIVSNGGFSSDFLFDKYNKELQFNDDKDVYVLNPMTGEIAQHVTGLPALYIMDPVYKDPLGLTWISSDNGAFILFQKPTYFLPHLADQKHLVSCRGFAEGTEGRIYAFTLEGKFIYHPSSGKIEPMPIKNDLFGLAGTTDANGNIWFSGEGTHLQCYTPATQQLRHYDLNVSDIYIAGWSIEQIRTGQILIGTTNGLWIKNPLDEENPTPFTNLNGFNILNESCIYHILETDEGIWLSTDHGLFLIDLITGVKEHITQESANLPNDNLLFLHKDTDNIYWIASRGGGLIRWDRARKNFRPYTVNEGLSHNVIYAIYEDDYGFFWMPSDFGLMRFEKSSGTCRTFLKPEGITHEEFNRASHFRDSKGNLYFGGLNGFISFHPKDLLNAKSVRLPVRITKFEAINEKTGVVQDLTYEASMSSGLRLGSLVSSFIIHYSILDYDDPQLKRFAYRIDGLNTNWTYLKENFIRINGLRGGEYTIRIKGQSSTGQWSENELIIPVTIMKPFFARWYTQAAMLMLMLLLFYAILRKRSELHKAKLKRDQEVIQQLRQVDKLKDQFLANTSHELRTPLNGIVGLSESLLEKIHTEAEVEDLELIIASGRRLSNLVNDILDFSRLKEHDLQLKKGPVDIRAVADLCLRMNRQLLSGKNLVLQNNIPENIPYCLADENRLQQILQNLVANAIKFTQAGSITIDAQEAEGMIITRVSDTGIGIEKEKQKSIFHEFEQADGSIAREYGGTGLGLSITKYLVELHGGSLGVESEVGKGSVFWFTIPVSAHPSAPKSPASFANELRRPREGDFNSGNGKHDSVSAPKSPASFAKELRRPREGDFNSKKQTHDSSRVTSISPPLPPKGGKIVSEGNQVDLMTRVDEKRQILVVDDEPVNLKVLKNHLESEGYGVTLAHDGQEALDILQNGNHFHLVLLDVMMPRIPGYEVCQRIREKYLLTELPVIMVTAKNQVSDLVEGLGIGANDYIVKPFSKDELLARVKTQLDNYEIHEATNRFVPHEFIHSLGRQSIMDLVRGDMVEQNVHVMFSDIRDYTSLAEDMTPSENFKFVNTLAGKVGPIVKENHGMINQYLGDTIMMLFMQKADDGVQAGVDILRMIREYNTERQEKKRKLIRLGIGLHSGPLMMGIIGDSMRTDAAVISDTVNTASRMEGLTKHFNVNFILSADTLSKLEDRDRFNLRYLGKVQAKGKNQSIDVYECFDGDTAEQIKLKKTSLPDFLAGMEAYYAKDMIEARKFFDAVYQKNPMDLTAFGYLHKIHGLMVNGLPENWNGVEVMQNK